MYLAIDLKSFYASVECAARGLDPLKTNLVVADAARTEKTICLAVSPSLKAYGIAGRARLFEVVQRVEQVNAVRRQHAPGRQLRGQRAAQPLAVLMVARAVDKRQTVERRALQFAVELLKIEGIATLYKISQLRVGSEIAGFMGYLLVVGTGE